MYNVRGERVLDFAGPKGYEHGWKYVGGPGLPSVAKHEASGKTLKAGDRVSHPDHGAGTVHTVHKNSYAGSQPGLHVKYDNGKQHVDIHPSEVTKATPKFDSEAKASVAAIQSHRASERKARQAGNTQAANLHAAAAERHADAASAPKVKNPNSAGLAGFGKYGQKVDQNSAVDRTDITHNGAKIGEVRMSSTPGNRGKYVASAPGRRDTVHDTKQLAAKRLVNEHAAGQLKTEAQQQASQEKEENLLMGYAEGSTSRAEMEKELGKSRAAVLIKSLEE